MELKPGYKQTEVGVIPEDWEVSAVGREFQIELGKMLDSARNIGVLKPYLGNKSVQWDRIEINNLPMVAMSKSDMDRFRLRQGDLLVCEGGEVGRAAIWEAPIEECYYQKALHRLRPLRKFNTRLMLALLRYWTDHDMLLNYVSQTSIAHLTREKLAEIPMPVPTPEEQSTIAGALGDVDDLIRSLDCLIAKKRDIKQAAMQQLLTGKRRLPGFTEEWEVKSVGSVAPLQRGFDLPSSQLKRGSYPVVYSNGILNHHAKFQVRGPGVVTGRSGTIGRVNFIEQDFWPHNTSLWVTDFKGNAPKYIYYLLESIGLERLGTGSGVPTLNRNDVHAFEVSIPPSTAEQRAIASVLSDMDAEVSALEQRRDKTRAIKQGMMQELLTGKTRLVEAA
ncbi:MAG: restriction endonuclease subunit S [Pyrinomonadaceae bacterium]